MPFCTHCGNQVQDADFYCARCGARQPNAGPHARKAPPALDTTLSPRWLATLCYVPVVGWIAAIVVLAAAQFRHDRTTRFHAFQGLYLFAAWLFVRVFLPPFMGAPFFHNPLPALLTVFLFALGIFLAIKTHQGETVRLPVLGELAERSVAEQA